MAVIEKGGIGTLPVLMLVAIAGVWFYMAFKFANVTRKDFPKDRFYYGLILFAVTAMAISNVFFLGKDLAGKDRLFGQDTFYLTWAIAAVCIGLGEVFRGRSLRLQRAKRQREWPLLDKDVTHQRDDPLTCEPAPDSPTPTLVGVFFLLCGGLTLGYYAINISTTLETLSSDWHAVLPALTGLFG